MDPTPPLPDEPPPTTIEPGEESLPYNSNRFTVVCASGHEFTIYAPTLVEVFAPSGRMWVSEPRDAKVLVDNPPSFKAKK